MPLNTPKRMAAHESATSFWKRTICTPSWSIWKRTTSRLRFSALGRQLPEALQSLRGKGGQLREELLVRLGEVETRLALLALFQLWRKTHLHLLIHVERHQVIT